MGALHSPIWRFNDRSKSTSVASGFGAGRCGRTGCRYITRYAAIATCHFTLCRDTGFSSLNIGWVVGVITPAVIAGILECDEFGAHLGAGQASGLGSHAGRCLRRVIAGGEGWYGNHGGKGEGGNVLDIHEVRSDV
jgi:hypothetical protein